jgi:acetyl-CoA C-acetyltransferase
VSLDPRAPCLIGVAQRTWRDGPAPEPLDMQAEVASAAAGGALARVGWLGTVHCLSWTYDDPPGRLADRLGIDPAGRVTSTLSGTSAQSLLLQAARAIRAGELEVGLVVGGEALATRRRAKRDGQRLAWSHPATQRPAMPMEFHPSELAHEVFQAYVTFALRDSARRAHRGLGLAEHRRMIGELLAPLSAIAAANPHAWFPTAYQPADISEPGPDNRMVAFPYTKRSVAFMDVDMAAAVVIASHETADRLGVPPEDRVYLHRWAEASDPAHPAEHPELWRSPAMAWCAAQTCPAPELVTHLDLYSCFPSALWFALDALGWDDPPPAGLTVTGGLPYAGGPSSNYLGHSITSMVETLRADPGSVGLTTGIGMHMEKHSWATWSTDPPTEPVEPPAPPPPARRPIADHPGDDPTVAAVTVIFDRSGEPSWGLCILEDRSGARSYARVDDGGLLGSMGSEEWVGRTVAVTVDGPVNRVTGASAGA